MISRYSEKVQQRIATKPWPDLVRTVRNGPPAWSPTKLGPLDELANAVEFFVHHEDVRRAAPMTTDPRPLDPQLEDLLRSRVRHAKLLVRRAEVGLVLRDLDHTVLLTHKPGADRQVVVTGSPGELLLYVYGRQAHTTVEEAGAPADVAVVQHTSFGI